jgi:hypothetical protein
MEPRLTNQISSLYNIVTPARNEEDTIGEVLWRSRNDRSRDPCLWTFY